MTERICVFRKAACLGLALLAVSAATDAAGPAQRAQAAPAAQPHQAAFAPPAQGIDLTVGAQRQIAVGHTLQRVAIGDPSVADVLIIKGDKRGGVLLVGKAAGTTNLMLWSRDRDAPLQYTVNVTTPAAASLLGADTPAVKVLGGTAIVSGTSATMEAHQRAVVAAEGSLGKDGAVFDTSRCPNSRTDPAHCASRCRCWSPDRRRGRRHRPHASSCCRRTSRTARRYRCLARCRPCRVATRRMPMRYRARARRPWRRARACATRRERLTRSSRKQGKMQRRWPGR